jgi:hypothetical protein
MIQIHSEPCVMEPDGLRDLFEPVRFGFQGSGPPPYSIQGFPMRYLARRAVAFHLGRRV